MEVNNPQLEEEEEEEEEEYMSLLERVVSEDQVPGAVELVREVLNTEGVDVNQQNGGGDTALHIAASRKNCEIVELLLQYNANVFIKNGAGNTPKDEASHGHENERSRRCRLLIDQAIEKTPLQLAKIEQHCLVLIPTTLDIIRTTFPRNIEFVGIMGVGRSGKSWLCKHLTNPKVSFEVSRDVEPCTYGIYISQPQPQDNGEYIVYVDSEGTEMGDTSQQHKILSLVSLILWDGGVLIDNEKTWSNSSLNTLSLLASTQQLIGGVEGNGWPYLCFLLRNFEEEIRINRVVASTDQFLEYILRDNNDARDLDRRVIRDCFIRRKLFVLSTPTSDDRNSETLPDGKFKNSFELLRNWILSAASPKTIGGSVCDGDMLVRFLEECVNKINLRGNITMASAVEATIDPICSRIADALLTRYRERMAAEELITGDDVPLQQNHTENSQEACNTYNARTQGLFPVSVERYQQVLINNITTQYGIYQSENRAVREEIARAAAEQARVVAEQARQQEERQRIAAEQERQAAQEREQQAEQARAAAERQRMQAERERQAAQERERRESQARAAAEREQQAAQERERQARIQAQRDIEAIRNSIVNSTVENKELNVGGRYNIEASRKTRWHRFGQRDTVWFNVMQKIQHQSRTRQVRGDGSVEYTPWANTRLEERVVDQGSYHE